MIGTDTAKAGESVTTESSTARSQKQLRKAETGKAPVAQQKQFNQEVNDLFAPKPTGNTAPRAQAPGQDPILALLNDPGIQKAMMQGMNGAIPGMGQILGMPMPPAAPKPQAPHQKPVTQQTQAKPQNQPTNKADKVLEYSSIPEVIKDFIKQYEANLLDHLRNAKDAEGESKSKIVKELTATLESDHKNIIPFIQHLLGAGTTKAATQMQALANFQDSFALIKNPENLIKLSKKELKLLAIDCAHATNNLESASKFIGQIENLNKGAFGKILKMAGDFCKPVLDPIKKMFSGWFK